MNYFAISRLIKANNITAEYRTETVKHIVNRVKIATHQVPQTYFIEYVERKRNWFVFLRFSIIPNWISNQQFHMKPEPKLLVTFS